MNATLRLTEALIARPSVTPEDAGCLELITQRLQRLGFVCERMDSGPDTFRVSNLWAKRPGATPNAPTLVWLATPTWCPPARWSNGTARRSSPPTATACCTDAVPVT